MIDNNFSQEELVKMNQQTIALVRGEAMTILPKDLYIPPDALEIFLEAFEGPLDLLLYLIRKQDIDVLDIPIAEITRQYMQYIDLMQNVKLELAAEYLVMAAMLAEIKSRMLLPRPAESEEGGDDPRTELVRRLQEYERIKQASEDLDTLPRLEREFYKVDLPWIETSLPKPLPTIELKDILLALQDVFARAKLSAHHYVHREILSVRERMTRILARINGSAFVRFQDLFATEEGRMGVVVTFIAILELWRQSAIDIVQAQPYAPLHVKAKNTEEVALVP